MGYSPFLQTSCTQSNKGLEIPQFITVSLFHFSVASSSNSSIQEELPSGKSPRESRSVELASQHSSGPRSAASSHSSTSSKKRGKKERKCST